jgi:hypothetical protein
VLFGAQSQSPTEWCRGDLKELKQLPKGPHFSPNWDLHAGRILLNIFKNLYLLTLSKLHHHAFVAVCSCGRRKKKMVLWSPRETRNLEKMKENPSFQMVKHLLGFPA